MTESTSGSLGPFPPFAYDGQVGEEKLGELLAVGAELPSLDFKKELNLRDPGKKLDFVKDCAAMMNLPRGGYLVIGANDDGSPAKGYEEPTKEMFDSAALTQIVKGYVDAPVDIRAQVHTLQLGEQAATMAVIYVAPPVDGIPAAMSKTGTLPSKTGGKPNHHFHEGTVFTREGTVNVVVSHRTWGQVLENFRAQQRAESRQDVDALIHRTVQMLGSAASPRQIVPDLAMDAATFTEAVRASLTEGNERVVRRFLLTAKNAYRNSVDDSTRTGTLDRIAGVAAEAVAIRELPVLTHVMDTLFELYKDQLQDPASTGGKQGAPAKWLEITVRVMAIGAAAVRCGMYEAIPTIVLRRIGDETYSYRSWIRHGLTEASRAGMLVRSDASPKGGNLIAIAADLLQDRPELRPDVEFLSENGSSEAFLDSLCQFDFLWCCLSLAAAEKNSSAAYYPSCSAYHQHRVMPIVLLLDNDAQIRDAIFGQIPAQDVADAIMVVTESAHEQSFNYGGWWDGARALHRMNWIGQNSTGNVTM